MATRALALASRPLVLLPMLMLACGDTPNLGTPGPRGNDDGSATSADAGTAGATRIGWRGPQFAGAGSVGAGDSIAAGLGPVTCGGQGASPFEGLSPAPGATSTIECLYDEDDPTDPAATIEWIVETAQDDQLVHVRLTFNPRFVDNTYGVNAIGWERDAALTDKPAKSGHTFRDLVGSDHAEFKLSDGAGALALHFKLDYVSEARFSPSGHATLGVSGGEGKLLLGRAEDVLAASTSIDRNLNACGLSDYLVDSPATDESYTPNPAASGWDYRVVYDVWVRKAAFGAPGFGKAAVDFVHASPSKADSNTLDVTPGDCPPAWPPYCAKPEGCDECGDLPDESCGEPSCDEGECADAGEPVPQ